MAEDIKCKICYSLEDPVTEEKDLISPCNCKGSLKYVHASCLKMWRYKSKYSNVKKCLQCGMYYKLKDEVTPNNIFLFLLTISILSITHLLISLVFFTCSYFVKSDFYDLFFFNCAPSFYSVNLHITTSFVYILIFKVAFYNNFLSVFNFVFTYWRIVQLDFFIDRLLYGGLCLYYSKQMYGTLFNRLEHYYVISKEKHLN